ncbi:P21-Rho-binding domain, variant 2 [Trifolium repens]|nr:CRIB domain-containing protein RIC6 [Trifolium repens]WJX18878.1 P21-Rho-binding domain, variant 2 [Trifolium repens]
MNQGGGTSIKMNPTAVKGQMKGLLKGLRYISQMFDEEEDKEIQIGFPTDVKHLAHIGCEDAKANAPSWMTEFKETQEQPGANAKISEGQDSGNNSDSSSIKGDGKKSHIRRSRQRSTDSQSSPSSPQREETGSTKPSRRHHSTESSRRSSRQSNDQEDENSKPPKQSHRRKPKTSSEEKDKDSSHRRRTRRSSKADSLTDSSFTDLGSGSASGPSAQ